MTTEYKQKNDIPNLYDILGLSIDVCKEDNCDELIQKAYLKKVKVCNPGKYPGRKDVAEVFELLNSAYDILKDEKQRSAYNHKLSLNKQSSNDFFKLKKGTVDYMQTVGEYTPPTDLQKLSFKEQMSLLNNKHGYDSSQEGAISKGDARKRMGQLNQLRATQDRDLKPENLFDGMSFDLQKFNAAFDKVHKRDDGTLILHGGVPSAWNDLGSTANFSSFDNLDNLYVDDGSRVDTSRQIYGGVDFAEPMTKLTKEDMNTIEGADYVTNHNVISDDYYREMKAKLHGRQSDANSFDNMKYGDFKRDDTAGYGIFDQLGFKFDDTLALDVDDDISKKFEKMMLERQKDIIPSGPNQSLSNFNRSKSGGSR